MPYTTVVAGTVITASWGNMVRDQLVTPFADAATRTAQVTVPVEGMVSYLIDVKRLEMHNGTQYVPAGQLRVGASAWTSKTDCTAETIVANSSVTWTALASRRYRVTVSSMYSSTTAGDNVVLRLRSAAGATVTTGGTLHHDLVVNAAAANSCLCATFTAEITGIAAGQTTAGLFVARYSGGGTATAGNGANSNNTLIVEDVGA